MGVFFEAFQSDACCLCGGQGSLTGEHKIKASALRKVFGKDRMVIRSFDGQSAPRSAQGPKSEAFHFSSRICVPCNGARTQAADREFDRFHELVSSRVSEGQDPASVFELPQYSVGTEAYLNVFRYFSKLLCCHVAQSFGPRPLDLSRFAIGLASKNVVWLHIDSDPTYQDHRDLHGEHQFASHGGLVVPVDARTKLVTSFISSLTLGEVRYQFRANLMPMAGVALKLFHPLFWAKCQAAYQDTLDNPLPEDQRRRLGL